MPPQSMPIGFTYAGDPIYPAPSVAPGARQPLAMLVDGEPIWPVEGNLVPAGQPQPFGVLSSGGLVWAVEQRAPDPPAPWYRRRRVLVSTAALAGVLFIGAVATDGGSLAGQPEGEQAAEDRGAAERPAREAAERAAAQREAAERTDAVQEAEPGEPRLDFLMLDFAGKNLQDALDEVQELAVFFSLSRDLRGTRLQVLDSNWQVCTQTPPSGTRVQGMAGDWEGKISFAVVRTTEACP